MFGSPEQGKFLVSPTGGEDFFSDLGNDFSTGFFGGGNDKEGEEDGANFFSTFDESLPADGSFPLFGDSEPGNDDGFFFSGEEKDDKDDGGFNFF